MYILILRFLYIYILTFILPAHAGVILCKAELKKQNISTSRTCGGDPEKN